MKNSENLRLDELSNLVSENGLSKDLSSNAFENYLRFWCLVKKYPNENLVPTKEIDSIWHYHLSLPDIYRKDCNEFLGFVLKHKKNTDTNGLKLLPKKYEETKRKWLTEFNMDLGTNAEMAICESDDGWGVGDDYTEVINTETNLH